LIWWLSPTPPEFNVPHHPYISVESKSEFLRLYEQWEKDWPVATTKQFIDTEFGLTYVQISGPDHAPPLFLMHGARSNGLMWKPNIVKLSEHFRVVAVDIMYDNGRSVPSREISQASHYADWFEEVTSALFPDQKINLLGVSYGGWVSMQFALRYPDRLNKLILLAPAGIGSGFSFSSVFTAIKVAIGAGSIKEMIYWMIEDTMNSTLDNQKFAEEFIDLTIMGFNHFKSRKMVFPKPITTQTLNSVQVPILYLVGENEKIYSARQTIKDLNNGSPQIRTELILNAGHDLTVVQAELISQLTYDFIIN
jgi:pimeloyl-ACP methyl ester carboxylesterase